MNSTSCRAPTSVAATFAIRSPMTCSLTRTFLRISSMSSWLGLPARKSLVIGICNPSSYMLRLIAENPRPPMSGRWLMLSA